MESLAPTKRLLIRLHMCAFDDNDDKISDKWKSFSRIIIALLFIMDLSGLIGTLAFSFGHMSIDLQRSLFALLPAASLLNSIFYIVAAFFLRYKIKRIFAQLSAIHSASELQFSVCGFIDFFFFYILFFNFFSSVKLPLTKTESPIRFDFWHRQIPQANGF